MRLSLMILLIAMAAYSTDVFSKVDSLGKSHYLGNEGVMIEGKHRKLLFDPLFNKNYNRFFLVPEEVKSKIHGNVRPFNNVDLILVSHNHSDHFDAGEMFIYLSNNHHVQLVAPKQVVDEMRRLPEYGSIENQVHEISASVAGAGLEKTISGVHVEAIRIPHVGWPDRTEVENLVYRVTLDGFTVMHLGDSDQSPTHYRLYEEFFSKKVSNHAFIPGVFAGSGTSEREIRKMLNANKVTHIHIPMSVPEELAGGSADLFVTPGEVREINALPSAGPTN